MQKLTTYFLGIFSLLLLVGCGEEEIIGTVSHQTLYRPTGFPAYQEPEDNITTVDGVNLGRHLFYDPILSGDSSQSCGSCHTQAFGFTDDQQQFSVGIDGIAGDKNSMQLINLLWSDRLFWDGRVESLDELAIEPVMNPIEMHAEWPDVVEKLSRHSRYPLMFQKAFGTRTITKELAAKAMAQFMRTLISGNTRYHKYVYGLPGGYMTEEEKRGMELFFNEKGDCFHCHVDVMFTDNSFKNNGLNRVFDSTSSGLFNVTGDANDIGKFKVPTLINIEYTAPYMHDGRFNTLEEVLDHYSDEIQFSPTVDPLMRVDSTGLLLSDQQKSDLVAFLRTLTDEEFLSNPDHANPFE